MKITKFEKDSGNILAVISNPFRIKLLLIIGKGEVCVCHLEAILEKRQSFISQHLMALRKAGILETRREGKYVFYRLASAETFAMIEAAGKLAGYGKDQFPLIEDSGNIPNCCCPNCETEK